MRRIGGTHRSGFTIIETVLAIVVGGLVLLGCVSVFLASARSEKAYAQRFERTSEMWTTQLAVRRTFLNLLVEEQQQTAPASDSAQTVTETVRPRVILETDAAAPALPNGYRPQRLEVTVGRSPLPSIVGSQIGAWLVEQDRAESLDFASDDIASGAIRGVFELRPSGTREVIMMNLGLLDPDPKLMQAVATDPPRGWTLWWRPILSAELAELTAGYQPLPDTTGNAEAIRDRLAGAVPVLRGIEALRWQIFKSDERVTEYAGTSITDLPAFAELEVTLINRQYASWMFEIGWTLGEDPTGGGTGADDTDADGDGVPDGNNNGGGGGGGGGGPGGPGGGGRPGGRPGTNPGNTGGLGQDADNFGVGGRRP